MKLPQDVLFAIGLLLIGLILLVLLGFFALPTPLLYLLTLGGLAYGLFLVREHDREADAKLYD